MSFDETPINQKQLDDVRTGNLCSNDIFFKTNGSFIVVVLKNKTFELMKIIISFSPKNFIWTWPNQHRDTYCGNFSIPYGDNVGLILTTAYWFRLSPCTSSSFSVIECTMSHNDGNLSLSTDSTNCKEKWKRLSLSLKSKANH